MTLKPLSSAGWDSRINALQPLKNQPGEIYDALYEIYIDQNFDQESRHGAQVLCTKLKDYQFLYSLALWHDK